MKCLILAAGYATRLYPLTKNFPKPLLKVKNKTIIDWLIEDIDSLNKVDEYILVSNHKFYNFFEDWKAEKIENGFKNKITLIDDGTESNETRLGAVTDISLVIEKLNIQDDLMVVAGDNILNFSLKNFMNYFEQKKSICVMRYFTDDVKRLQKSANMLIDDSEKIINIIEKPEVPISNWCCPAFYIYPKTVLGDVKSALIDGINGDAPGSLVCWFAQNNADVHAYLMPGKRYDIGTIETYNEVNNSFNGIEL